MGMVSLALCNPANDATQSSHPISWVVPVASVVATLVGLFVFGYGLEQHSDVNSSKGRQGGVSDGSKPGYDSHDIEAVRLWAVSAAITSGVGAGLFFALAPMWHVTVCRTSGSQRWGVWLGMGAFAVIAALVLNAAPQWFRQGRRPVDADGSAIDQDLLQPAWARRLHPDDTTKFAGPNPHISWFVTRQLGLTLAVIAPLFLSLSALIAVGVYSHKFTSGECQVLSKSPTIPGGSPANPAPCQTQMNEFLDLRSEFMHYLAATLMMLVLVMLVLAMAQRALRLRTRRRDYYKQRDVLLFGGLASIVTGLIVLPTYSLLQASGYELAKDAVAAMKLPMGPAWFAARNTALGALAPPLTAKVFLAGAGAVLTPLLASVVAFFTTRSDPDEATPPKEQEPTGVKADTADAQ